jgi:RNA methyltransferase, TrmH family
MEFASIESLQNPRIKHAVRLRDAKTRRRSGEFLIDGAVEIARGLASGLDLKTIFYSAKSQLSADLATTRCLQLVSEQVLARISYGKQHAPVAIAVTPPRRLADLKLSKSSLVLVLDRTEKPGNLGACLRTASACGVDAVVLTNPVCELFNPNTIRASRGAVFSVPLAVVSPVSEFLELAKTTGLQLLAARVDGQHSLWDRDLCRGTAIVFGSEAHGLGSDWSGVESFQIPMQARVDSLNVSISAAVTLYEAIRQREVH